MKSAVMIGACVALAGALGGTASAQPGITKPVPPSATSREGEVSENVALGLSLGGTVASWALIVAASNLEDQDGSSAQTLGTIGGAGAMFAPSFGHWYAHSLATRGLALRAAGIVGVMLGVTVALAECPLFSGDECRESGFAPVLMVAGAGLFIGGTIDDIATAPGRARRYNQGLLSDVTVMPVLSRDVGGMAMTGRF